MTIERLSIEDFSPELVVVVSHGDADGQRETMNQQNMLLAFQKWWEQNLHRNATAEQQAFVTTVVRNLAQRSLRNRDRSERRIVYFKDMHAKDPEVTHWGRQLDELGGLGLMQHVFYRVQLLLAEQNHPFAYQDTRELEYAWNRIGEWMS